jgi:hypothetical protein
MTGMFKNFLIRKMIERQLGSLPPEQRDMIITAFEKDPDFFMRLAAKVEEKTKSGMGQMEAAQKVFAEHGDEMKKLMGL